MGIEESFKRFVADIVPSSEHSSNPMVYKTVFLKITLLMVLSFIGSFASFLYAVTDFMEEDTAVAIVEFLVGVLLLSTPFIARRYRNVGALSTLAIILFGTVFIVAIFDELPEDKSSLIWLNVLPALSFILKGRRGIYWSVGYLGVHLIFTAIGGKLGVESLFDAYLSYGLITVILYFYAWMSERYREVWESIARTDSLTGLLNRISFEELLNREVERAKRYGEELSLVIFDIDNFKDINDTYGHLFGDKVLKEIARVVSRNVRESDIIARWGGEEFIILLPNTPLDSAISASEKLRRKIELCGFEDGVSVTASFGVAQLYPEDDAIRLVLKADKALYEAKRGGKNKVVNFSGRVNLK